MELTTKLESWAKTAASAVAVTVSLIYLCGYLALRNQMRVLGIPAEVSAFDERYLFAGANYLIFLIGSLAQVFTIMLVAGAVAWILLIALRHLLLRSGTRYPLWRFFRLVRWRRVMAISLALAAMLTALVSINRAFGWQHEGDLLFDPKLSSPTAKVISAANSAIPYAVFESHLCASLASALLAFISARLYSYERRWVLMAVFVLTLQILTLPGLFGILTADRSRPKIRFANGDSGWLVWEDKDTLMYLRNSPPEIVRRPRSNTEPVTVIGYERILCPRVSGAAACLQGF